MLEKAFIGDDGSQVRRKRPVRPCGLTSKGLSLCLFELNYRIRGRTLRDESLETNTARDLEQVVRTFEETHAISAMANSTTQDVAERQKKRKSSQCELFLILLNYKSFALRRAFRNEPHQLLPCLSRPSPLP